VHPVEDGYCRLCWQFAWEVARRQLETFGGRRRSASSVFAAYGHGRLPGHQLVLHVGQKQGRHGRQVPPDLRQRTAIPLLMAPAASRPATEPVQLRLVDPPREYTRVDPDIPRVDPDNPWLAWALSLVGRRSEARGWNLDRRDNVVRGLRIVLTDHAAGDTITYTAIAPALQARKVTISRVVEVLTEMNLLVDDRPSTFEAWLERKLEGLAPGIATDVEAWLRTLRYGGPRTPALGPAAVYHRLSHLRPALDAWSERFDHLREVTRDDVLAVLEGHHGMHRRDLHVALRSLFAHCQRRKTIFRNPTARIRVGIKPDLVLQPLPADELAAAVSAATTPATRLLVAIAAIYGVRPAATRALRLDDVDLGNRRLLIAGVDRPIDDLTHHVLLGWLEYRRARWPDTANPYLLINQMTATGTTSVASNWTTKAVRGHTSLDKLRADRQLEEALASGGDPLHLAVMFGVDPGTAMRYANAARQLLTSQAEDHTATSSTRTQGSNRPTDPEHP